MIIFIEFKTKEIRETRKMTIDLSQISHFEDDYPNTKMWTKNGQSRTIAEEYDVVKQRISGAMRLGGADA